MDRFRREILEVVLLFLGTAVLLGLIFLFMTVGNPVPS